MVCLCPTWRRYSRSTHVTQNSAARGQTTICPPHAACVAVHLDPASSSPCCVGHGLAFCPYHSCLPRYKALADYPSSRRSPTLRSPRRLHGPSGLPTAWQTGPAACSISNEAYLPPIFAIAWTPIRISGTSRMMAMGNGKTTAQDRQIQQSTKRR
jgi:hypothetical protein